MKNLLKNLKNAKPLIAAVVLLVGLSFVTANTWSNPTGAPVANNSDAPIDEGTSNQEKQGQLTTGTLTNLGMGPVVTYSPFYVGLNDGSTYQEAKSTFYGPLNLIGTMDPDSATSDPLCIDWTGKVKICSDGVVFEPIQKTYYTSTNTLTFPTSGITGAVKYDISSSQTCKTLVSENLTKGTTGDSTWVANTSISGKNNNYSVVFNDWGAYKLSIECTNGSGVKKTFSVNIDVKGKIIPTAKSTIQKFLFSGSHVLEITSSVLRQ